MPKGTAAKQRGSRRCGYNFFWWSHIRLKGLWSNKLPAPAFCPFVCWCSDGQRPQDFQLQTACISKDPLRQSLHNSVSPSLSQYNDSLCHSGVLMPIGYLFRISHTFIYELSPFCPGRGSDWIVRSQFSSLTVHLPHFTRPFSPGPKLRLSKLLRAVHRRSPWACKPA